MRDDAGGEAECETSIAPPQLFVTVDQDSRRSSTRCLHQPTQPGLRRLRQYETADYV